MQGMKMIKERGADMSRRDAADPRTSMWDFIGYYLRFLRTSRGLTGAEAGHAARCSAATISRIETGEQRMSEQQAERLDVAWRTGGLFATLIYYARRASNPDWFKSFVRQEQDADRIRIFAGQHVPGLLQTPEYARALLEAGRTKDKEGALRQRMARQEILQRADPPDIWVILAQSALSWPVGGHAVLAAQLSRLVELSSLPNVSIRVVPPTAGAYEGLDGPFMILGGRDGEVAFVEAPSAGRLVTDADEVKDFVTRFDRIGMTALPIDATLNLIKRTLEDMQ